MKSFTEKWINLVQNYKPLTLADLHEDSPLYVFGQMYRDKLGKTIEELPDESIIITQISNEMSEDILMEVSVTFTYNI